MNCCSSPNLSFACTFVLCVLHHNVAFCSTLTLCCTEPSLRLRRTATALRRTVTVLRRTVTVLRRTVTVLRRTVTVLRLTVTMLRRTVPCCALPSVLRRTVTVVLRTVTVFAVPSQCCSVLSLCCAVPSLPLPAIPASLYRHVTLSQALSLREGWVGSLYGWINWWKSVEIGRLKGGREKLLKKLIDNVEYKERGIKFMME